jgi:hypothetical protein
MYVQLAVMFMILLKVTLMMGLKRTHRFEALPDDWVYPACGTPKSMFEQKGATYE